MTVSMRKNLEQNLANRFPSWFSVNGDVHQTLMPFGFQCGDEWYNIVWRLCVDLEPLVAELEKESKRSKLTVLTSEGEIGVHL